MPQLRVLLAFASASDHSLKETAQSVLDSLYGNPAYPTPPVPKEPFKAALGDFRTSVAAAAAGGPAETADKNKKRQILIGLLRQLAGYVKQKNGNSLAILLSSGFKAVRINNSPTQLEAPTIKDIVNGMSTQLIIRVGRVKNARCYELRYALLADNGTPGPFVDGQLFSNSRGMNVNGLIPGGNYQFQVRAVGGSTRYSDWSDPVSHRSL